MIAVEVALRASPHHGEGPWWDADRGALVWVDIEGRAIHVSDPYRGIDRVLPMPERVGAAVGRADGGMVALLERGFAAVADDGTMEWLARTGEGARMRLNDGKCDPDGQLVGGTMSLDLVPGAGSLYRLDRDLKVTRLLRDVTISNGLAWSGDGRTMYFIDSATQAVRAYAYSPDLPDLPDLGSPRTVVEVSRAHGVPDGMTIDTDGCLWVAMAMGGTVRRYTPDGRLDTVVDVPVVGVTSCAFGGSDLADLFITTSPLGLNRRQLEEQPLSGSVFVCRPGVAGIRESPFAG